MLGVLLSPSLPVAKVKPYTVIDLATRQPLSEEEVDTCLMQANKKQLLKHLGEYDTNKDFAKPNGDPPNCILLPPKLKKSYSLENLPDILADTLAYSSPSRARSYTAPSSVAITYTAPILKSRKASRVSPSPGSAKRKVQQQIAQRSMQAPRKYNGLRAPTPVKSSVPKPTPGGCSSPITRSRLPARTGLPRMSPHSSYATDDAFTNGESKTLPKQTPKRVLTPPRKYSSPATTVKGNITPPNKSTSLRKNTSVTPPASNAPAKPMIPLKKGIPSRSCSAMDSKKLSYESLRLSRENTAEKLRPKTEKIGGPRSYSSLTAQDFRRISVNSNDSDTTGERQKRKMSLGASDKNDHLQTCDHSHSAVIPIKTTNTSLYATVSKINKKTFGTNNANFAQTPAKVTLNKKPSSISKIGKPTKLKSPGSLPSKLKSPETKVDNTKIQTPVTVQEHINGYSISPTRQLNDPHTCEEKTLNHMSTIKPLRSQSYNTQRNHANGIDSNREKEELQRQNAIVGRVSPALSRKYGTEQQEVEIAEARMDAGMPSNVSLIKKVISDLNDYAEPNDAVPTNWLHYTSEDAYKQPVDSLDGKVNVDLKHVNELSEEKSKANGVDVNKCDVGLQNGDKNADMLGYDSDGKSYDIETATDPFNSFVKEIKKIGGNKTSPSKTLNKPKILLPPPQLLSCNEGLTRKILRTPSTDGEELDFYPESDVIKQMARETALKAWKKHPMKDVSNHKDDGDNKPAGGDSEVHEGDEENALSTSDPFDNYITDIARRHPSSDTSSSSNMFQLHTMTLERDKKKKSKLKKLFKKLSSKKESKIEFEYRFEGKKHSTHSLQDFYVVNDATRQMSLTPTSKRRVFNFSFMKKRCNTAATCGPHVPSASNTVRALCSPDMSRKGRHVTRRVSDSSIYRIKQPTGACEVTSQTPTDEIPTLTRKPRSATLTFEIPTTCDRTKARQKAYSSSVSSSTDTDEVEYINFPFSKNNIRPPCKPTRTTRDNYEGNPGEPYSPRPKLGSSSSQPSTLEKRRDLPSEYEEWRHRASDDQLSRNSSDTSIFSDRTSSEISPNPTPPRKYSCDAGDTNSLRRTPLRHSNDNFNKLVEVHKQTIERLSAQISTRTCACDVTREWRELKEDDSLDLGINNYMVVNIEAGYSAWLSLNQPHQTNIDLSKHTLHPNCLHVCHVIESNQSLMYVSPFQPQMSLSRYAGLCIEKHLLAPEVYEREVTMLFLQVVKGVQHLYKNGVLLSTLSSHNVFLSRESVLVMSPHRKPNKCPAVVVAALPGLNYSPVHMDNTIACVSHELAFILLELLHCQYHNELRDAQDVAVLQATLPTITVKSIYSRYLQHIINLLVDTNSHPLKFFRDLRLILEVVLFGPTDVGTNLDLVVKWHNRRCIDIVTHLLQATPLIMLNVSRTLNQPDIDQEILLETEFLANVSAQEIQKVSLSLDR